MSHRSAYLWLRVVELTSIPLAAFMALYVISGYGMLAPRLTRVLGLGYRVSAYLHTNPTLRYLTSLLAALHGCGGVVLLARRYARDPRLRWALELLGVAYAAALVAISTAVEAALAFG